MFVKKLRDIAVEPVAVGRGVSRQMLISPAEGPHFAMRIFSIEPGGFMPLHTNSVEHEQYVLQGCAEVSLGGELFEVEKDDVVLIPSGVPHYYRNKGTEPFTFLCLIPNQEDIIDILEQEKD